MGGKRKRDWRYSPWPSFQQIPEMFCGCQLESPHPWSRSRLESTQSTQPHGCGELSLNPKTLREVRAGPSPRAGNLKGWHLCKGGQILGAARSSSGSWHVHQGGGSTWLGTRCRRDETCTEPSGTERERAVSTLGYTRSLGPAVTFQGVRWTTWQRSRAGE